MNEYGFGSRDRPEKLEEHRICADKIQFFLKAEDRLLQLIFSRAPLPGVLNGICIALDSQIGNVVSLISLPDDGASELDAIAANAELFGLHDFCSGSIAAGNHELLGSLEMYCSIPRSPSASELQLIERAKSLAAIAIQFDRETGHQVHFGMRENRRMRARVSEWPVSFN